MVPSSPSPPPAALPAAPLAPAFVLTPVSTFLLRPPLTFRPEEIDTYGTGWQNLRQMI